MITNYRLRDDQQELLCYPWKLKAYDETRRDQVWSYSLEGMVDQTSSGAENRPVSG